MKKIIFAGIFAAFSNFTTAQVVIPATGSYHINSTMSGFHGTWRWVQGFDTVRIFLDTKGVFFDSNGGYHSDMLIGWHIYKRGNSIVESSFSSINIVNGSTIMGSNESNTSNVVAGYFEDLSKRRAGEIKLTLDATATQITWELKTAP